MPDTWFRADATTRTRGGLTDTVPVFKTLTDTTPVDYYASNEENGTYVAHVYARSGILDAIRNLSTTTEIAESEALTDLRAMAGVADDVTAESFRR